MSNDNAGVQASPAWIWQLTNYAGPADTGQAMSWVRCSIAGQTGVELRLVTESPAPSDTGLWTRTGTRGEYGPFYGEFGPLKAGRYVLVVDRLNLSIPLWLDGTGSAAVTIFPAHTVSPSGPRLPHVLLLGRLMQDQENFLALTRYVARFGAVVTFDPLQAMRAEHVIVIGSSQLVSTSVEQQVRAAGVRVERAQGDIAGQLDKARGAGTPFISN